MSGPYKAIDVAQVVLDYYKEKNKLVTNLVLQKVLFFTQWHFLCNFSKPCFEDLIKAFPLGPVVPNVYNECKIYGSSQYLIYKVGTSDSLSEDDKSKTQCFVSKLINYKASKLVNISHKEGGCWDRIVKLKGIDGIITNDDIKQDSNIYTF